MLKYVPEGTPYMYVITHVSSKALWRAVIFVSQRLGTRLRVSVINEDEMQRINNLG